MSTPELPQRRVQGYGWVPDLPDARDYLYSAPEPVLSELPRSVDLRPQCPPVYDQGQLGSCTANAIGAAFEFDQLKQELPDFMPSRLFIYYNEREIEGTIDTDSGAMIRDGMKSVSKLGVCSEDTWAYDIPRFTERPPDQAYAEALDHQALVYRRVPNRLHQMQACLAQGYPFVFGFTVYDSFEGPEVAKTGEVPLPPRGEAVLGGHAVLAVGYDDTCDIPAANPDEAPTRGALIIRNSWGPLWGHHGYGYLPYRYVSEQMAVDFWTVLKQEWIADKQFR